MAAIIAAPLVGLGLSSTAATTLATIGLYAATTAASIFLQMAMAEEPKQEIGTKLTAVLGGAVNQSIHVGEKESAGSFIYKGAWGRAGKVPNAFLTRVYALSDRPVEGFQDYVWVDGIKCPYNPEENDIVDGANLGHPIKKLNAHGGHRLWVRFHDGSQANADNYLVSKFGSGDRPWTEDHIGVGRAYMIVTQKYDKKAPTGEVEVLAVVRRSRLYDLRNDSTNGGSGAQRYDEYNTYAVEPGNPVVCAYNVMRGIYRGGEWMYGGQKWPATRFDNDTWVAAANQCDVDVNASGGGTIKWARVGAEIDVSEEPWAVIERFLKASNGRLVESGGKFKIYVGGIGASVYSFSDNELIASEELTGRLFPTRDQVANTVNGTYIEPANAGEAKAYKARTKDEYVDEDGDVRKTTLDFEYVRENRQAQRMAKFALNDNRRFRTFVVAFWSQARKLEPCDVISWTSDRFQFTAKKFIVGDVVLRDDGIVVANLREADSNDADWNPLTDEDPFETGVFEEVPEPTQTFTATVTGVALTDDAGNPRRPAIRIQATLDDDFVDCRALRVQVRKKFGDQKIVFRKRFLEFFDQTDGEDGDPDNLDYGDITFTSQAISTLKAKWVQVRYKIDPESDRKTEWTDWAAHEVNLDDLGIDDDDTSDELLAAPTGLSVTKVQDKDEDGTIRTFLKLNCTAPAWAGEKAEFIYEVVVASDDTYRVKSKSEKARFRVNRTGRLHTVRARARNGVGRLSNWTSSVSLTPSKKGTDADAVTGISISRKNGSIIIKWNKISDPDNREVAIYRGTTNVFASMTEIGRTKSTRWRDDDNITKGTRYYYRVLPVDTSDNVGTETASVDDVETGIDDGDTDDSTLAAPTGLTLTKVQDVDEDGSVKTFIKLECTPPGWATAKTTYVYSVTVGSDEFTVKSDDVKARFRVQKTNVLHTVKVRGVKGVGTKGSWSGTSTITPSKKTTGAGSGAGLAVLVKPKGLRLRWNRNTDSDYKETIIYRGTTNVFGSAVEIDRVKGTTLLDSDDLTPGTTYYYWIAHVTTSDVVGTQSASVNAVWRLVDDGDTDDSTLAAPTGLTLTKVQDVDEDGSIKTFIKLECTPPGWATSKTTYVYSVTVGSDEFTVKSDDVKARFRVQKTNVLHTVKVRGVKGVGTKGSWSGTSTITPSKKTTGAGTGAGLAALVKPKGIRLRWNRNTDSDYKETVIYRGTTNVFGSAVELDRVAGTTLLDSDDLTPGTTYYYWIAHNTTSDVVGTQSASVNAVWRKIDDDDTDDTTLAAPTGLSVTKVQDVDEDGKVETYLKLDCTPPGWANAKTTYAYSVVVGSDEFKIKSDDPPARFKVHKTGQSHTVKVRAIKGVGNKSSWSGTVALTPSKKGGGGVPAVGSITVTSKKSRIKIDWPDIDDETYKDYKKTFIYRNTTGVTPTIGVTAVHKKTSAGYYIDENVTTGVTYYYWVAHRDQTGNFSGLAAANGASGGNEVTTFTDLSGYVSSGQIGSGEVKTVNVDTSAIITSKIASDAASSSSYVLQAGSMSISTSQVSVVSTTANLTDNVDIQIGVQFVNIDASGRNYVVDIYIGGSLVWQTGVLVPAGALFYTAPIFSGYSGSSVTCELRLTAAASHFISNRAIGVRPRKR